MMQKRTYEKPAIKFDSTELKPSKVDFDSLLAELEDQEREKESEMKPEEVGKMLTQMEDNYLKEYLEQINKETKELEYGDIMKFYKKYFLSLFSTIEDRIQKEVGGPGNLEASAEAMRLLSLPLSRELTRHNRKKQSGVMAYYSPSDDSIAVDYDEIKMTLPDLIGSLAAAGYDWGRAAMHHEMIHSKQHPLKIKETKNKIYLWQEILSSLGVVASSLAVGRDMAATLFSVQLLNILRKIKNLRIEEILREVQANEGAFRYTKKLTYSDLFEVYKGNLLKNSKDVDCLISGYQQVKQLYALDLNDEEIGGLVEKAKWDDRKMVYDALQDKIESCMSEQNLDEDDLGDLVLRDDLKRRIYLNKVRKIAQEEIKIAYDKTKQG